MGHLPTDKTIGKLRRERAARDVAGHRELVEHKKKQQAEDAKKLSRLASALSFASATRISDFKRLIVEYQSASTAALLQNEKRLTEVNDLIQSHLDQAFVLADGRPVFKTQDGTAVFDELGQELSDDEVGPDEIPDHLNRWEALESAIIQRNEILEERSEILEFEQTLEAAQDEIDEGSVTEERLKELEHELDDAMPMSMREGLGLTINQNLAPQQGATTNAPKASDMRLLEKRLQENAPKLEPKPPTWSPN